MFRMSKRVSRKPKQNNDEQPQTQKQIDKMREQEKKNNSILGNRVWVPHRKQVWALADVLFVDDSQQKITVQMDSKSKSQTTFQLSDVRLFDEGQLDDFEDMSKMGDLNEASNLMLLKRRYLADSIYTLNGDILISMNPYKTIPGLYDSFDGFERPKNKDHQQRSHLFSVADNAYQSMMGTDTLMVRPRNGKNQFCRAQSVLINGESGSGKTEASKYVMRYLAHLSHAQRVQRHRQEAETAVSAAELLDMDSDQLADVQDPNHGHLPDEIGTTVEQCVIQSNPLLEAFGNAKTIRNDNSSRFGKYILVHYDGQGCIDGASNQHYLLEKSRIVEHDENERNYHIFYQMLRGLDEETAGTLQLLEPASYHYLAGAQNCQMDDAEEFQNTLRAMRTVGIRAEDQMQIWRILTAVLELGNVAFESDGGEEGSRVATHSVANMEHAAELLGIPNSDLETALCFRTVKAGKRVSVSVVKMNPAHAADSRNGLAKAIYSELFDWLVGMINKSTRFETESQKRGNMSRNDDDDDDEAVAMENFIGILDIFGFEVLNRNSFEQFCINFANEVLQREFDNHVFALEQRLYVDEGIDWSMLTFQDNSSLLELFEKRRTGIFSLLDEQGMLGARATDEGLLKRIFETHAESHARFEKPRFAGVHNFTIKHFAGPIVYEIDGFIAKNNDSLHHDLSNLLVNKTENNGFFHALCVNAFQPNGSQAQHAITTLHTVSSRLRTQMASLVDTLEQTVPHFIRCIKPNHDKTPDLFDAQLVLNQLTYLGVMEAVRIRREGFPVRRSFQDLVTKYAILLTGTGVDWTPPASKDQVTEEEHDLARLACHTILEKTLGGASRGHGWQIGKSGTVFLREGVLNKLDVAVRELMNRNATALQALLRRRRAQAEMKKKRTAANKIAATYRTHVAERNFQDDKGKVVKLQSHARKMNHTKRYARTRHGFTALQACRRGQVGRAVARKKRRDYTRACVTIQQWFRMTGPYLEYKFMRDQASKVQAIFRGILVRVRWERLRKARDPWKAFLKPNEAVALTSLVVKSTPNKILKGIMASKKRRQLILTTCSPEPRIIYVDPSKMVLKGEIPWKKGVTEATAFSEKDFIICSEPTAKKPGRTSWDFVNLLDNSPEWVESVQSPISVIEMLKIGSEVGDDLQLRFMRQKLVVKQGHMMKLAINSQKNWRKRWFVLYNSQLCWFKGEKAKKSKGSIPIGDKTTVAAVKQMEGDEDTKFKQHCFEVYVPSLEKGVRFQCENQTDCDGWVAAIKEAVAFANLE